MANLTEILPDAKTLLALEPEELGDVILEMVNGHGAATRNMFSMPSIMEPIEYRNAPEWPQVSRAPVTQAVAEAMAWLEHAGFIILDPTQGNGTSYRTLTRRGRQLQNRKLAAAYRQAAILPTGLVHPDILEKSHAAFMRGDHDIAVFAAFKAIEVAVRNACGFPDGELGVPLMRKAFHPETGPLTDKAVVVSEREATAALFAGAIGAAKNPTSHREFEMSKVEAARLILFASHLMSIVNARANLAA
ncbi:MAG: TIGR02391 family protein [Bryobacteraceae bacterium]|jgi:uncharacterized protein (TIGR02391 family)